MRNLIYIFASLVLLAGCSFSGEVINLDETQKAQTAKLKGAEFLSGGTPKVTTSGGYSVSSTVGSFQGQLTSQTSAGYKVFTSVQGQVVSE